MLSRNHKMVRPATFAASLLLAAVVGCNGWPKAAELSEAQHKPEKFPTYAKAPHETPTFTFENRTWMVMPTRENLHDAKLQQVGNAGTQALYAPAGSEAPHRLLFASAGGNEWYKAVPIE